MSTWDEQLPIWNNPQGQGTPGMGPMPGGAPGGGGNPLMQLMQMIAMRKAQGQGQPMSGGSPGMAPQGTMQAPTLPTLPGTTPMPMPGGGPSVMASMDGGQTTPNFQTPNEPRQREFATKSAAKAQTVHDAITSVANVVGAFKQKSFQTNSAKAEQMWHGYLGLQQALNDAQDPKAKQAIQQQLDKMQGDKDFIKTLEKAHKDPMSAEGIGLQRGIQAAQQDVARQLSMEQIQAKIQEAYAKAQSEQARQGYYQRKTELEGTLTPEKQAEIASREKISAGKDKSANWRAQTSADKGLQVAKIHAQSERYRTDKLFQAAEDRLKVVKAAAGQKTGSKELDMLTKEYSSVKGSLDELDKQQKVFEDKLKNKNWFEKQWEKARGTQGPDSVTEIDNRLAAIQTQREHLTNRVQQIDELRKNMEKFGAIPADLIGDLPDRSGETTTPEGRVPDEPVTPSKGSEDAGDKEPKGSGTEDDPVVIQ